MEDFKEEAYVLEKMEISEDDDEGFDYKEIEDVEDDIEDLSGHFDQSIIGEEDDLNDFEALKKKTEEKKAAREGAAAGRAARMAQAIPKTVERDVVIDDFIRNFL
jgi:hypothetical protein